VADQQTRPAYYAASPGRWRDWWTLLHPPFTAWHLAYVVVGAMLAPHVRLDRLVAALVAFFLAVGLAAHALDELHGRPLRTSISSSALIAVSVVGLAGAVGLGAIGITRVGWALLPFMIIGPLLVVGYNAELFGGLIHTDLGLGHVPGERGERGRGRAAERGLGPRGRGGHGALGRPAASLDASQAAPPQDSRSDGQHHVDRRVGDGAGLRELA